ncbi:hypothetical protein TUSST3_38160 [Streptomyces sp. TUS-ST3]|nr:hypothetical protein TUSST3_38160 [Streptomyces sp. TUS-ST3]
MVVAQVRDLGPGVLQQARRDRMPFGGVRVEDVLADPRVHATASPGGSTRPAPYMVARHGGPTNSTVHTRLTPSPCTYTYTPCGVW